MEENQIPEHPHVEVVHSKDGSSTLWAPDFDEHYHSIHGALTESRHVFLEAGLRKRLGDSTKPIHIFEMGFGTGLNALLTYFAPYRGPVHYTSIEKYPLKKEVWEKLNYGKLMENADANQVLELIHSCPWEEWVEIGNDFRLKKCHTDLLTFEPEDTFDLIYFDAFAPSSQAYLWSEEVMHNIFSFCNSAAVFTTYSAKGDVRRALLAAGFEVEKIPGPPGKREMLRATKT